MNAQVSYHTKPNPSNLSLKELYMTQTDGNLAHSPVNDTRYNDLCAALVDLGKQSGQGRDSQVKAMLAIVDNAFCGIIDLNKDKFGAGVDDAQRCAEYYYKAQTGSTIFDAKAGNQRKLASCLRVCIKLGSWSKGGPSEPLATVNKLMTLRGNLRKVPDNAGKLDDAANTLLHYARRQIKSDTLIDDDELRAMCFKKEAETRTVEDVLEGIRKAAQNLYDGKSKAGACMTPEVKQIVSATTRQLQKIAHARAQAESADGVHDDDGAGPDVGAHSEAAAAVTTSGKPKRDRKSKKSDQDLGVDAMAQELAEPNGTQAGPTAITGIS